MIPGNLYRIEAPHFVAGFKIDPDTNIVVFAAPILRWTEGKTLDHVMKWCKRKGHAIQRIA